MFLFKKTLSGVLSSVTSKISELKAIAATASEDAFDKEELAQVLQDSANEHREDAAHATIIADRLTGLVNVTNTEIIAEIARNKRES